MEASTTSVAIIDILDEIMLAFAKGNYFKCSTLCYDLITFSCRLKLRDEVFMGEILQSVFANFDEIMDDVIGPDKQHEIIFKLLNEPLQEVINAYKGKNNVKCYDSIKDMRIQATYKQLDMMKFGNDVLND